jgi:TetR/AcrR family transcriptional repressor of nem operon
VIAALAADVGRQSRTVRKAFTRELKGTLEFLARQVPGKSSSRQVESAAAAFSCMVGALILARAASDNEFSDRILKAAVARISDLIRPRKRPHRNI